MKKQWMQMTSLVLNCVLIVLVFWQGARLDDLELEMRRGLNGLETATRSETASVASRVERILDERARVIADYELMPTGLDQETQTLLANWRVTLRQWSADTQVTAEMTVSGKKQSLSLEHQGSGVFSAPVSLPVELGTGIDTAVVTVTTGGISSREEIGGWEDISMLLPVQYSGGGASYSAELQNGNVEIDRREVSLRNWNREAASVHDPVFRMLCNGTVVQERPGVRAYDEEDAVTYSTSWKPQPCKAGDELAETFTCTDDYGLTYTFVIARYWITVDGTLGEDYQDGDQYPTLTWE